MTDIASVLFDPIYNEHWHMTLSERAALISTLNHIKPEVSIEIGTFLCGSLRPISAASKRVYTFDIDANQHRASPQFSNVSFITGDSEKTLPAVIDELNASDEELNFILVDGSHEEEGVRLDLLNCLRYKPKSRPTVILMHDSINPVVRKGIMKAPWDECPYVHTVDLDFVHGMLYDRADIKDQMWGGLAAAIMLPEKRTTPLEIKASFEYSRLALFEKSIYNN